MKKILLLMFAMLPIVMAATPFEKIDVDGIRYVVDIGEAKASVASRGFDNPYSGVVKVRSEVKYNGVTYPVNSVAANAFNNCTALERVELPNSITIIGQAAFKGSGITEMILPNSVKSIYYWAFQNCSRLKKVTIGTECNVIQGDAFTGCKSLKTIICKNDNPALFNDEPFDAAHYANLTVVVPKGKTSDYQAADGWKKFANIVESAYDFEVDGVYYNITGPNTVEVTYSDEKYNSYSGRVVIPPTVKYDNKTYNVTAIGEEAFRKSTGLTSISIPSSVTRSSAYAFNACSGLTRVDISDLKAWCNISFEYVSDANPLVYAHHLYLNGSEITQLTVPDGVKALGPFQFYGCEELKSVTIPNSVESLGWSCFCDCKKLQTVTMGTGMKLITDHSFARCSQLRSITCKSSTPPTMKDINVFDDDTYSKALLKVPASVVSTYKSTNWWNKFTMDEPPAPRFYKKGLYYKVTGAKTVEVANGLDAWRTNSGNVKIPSTVYWKGVTYTVNAIGDSAFYGSNRLKKVEIPNSVINIGKFAFFGCTQLKTVIIGTSVSSIGDNAFNNCPSLLNVNCRVRKPPVIKSTSFCQSTYKNALLTVPVGRKSIYRSTAYWREFIRINTK